MYSISTKKEIQGGEKAVASLLSGKKTASPTIPQFTKRGEL